MRAVQAFGQAQRAAFEQVVYVPVAIIAGASAFRCRPMPFRRADRREQLGHAFVGRAVQPMAPFARGSVVAQAMVSAPSANSDSISRHVPWLDPQPRTSWMTTI